ncbi:hypothetical protein KSS87_005962, partial [Heliosperma pusillum]
ELLWAAIERLPSVKRSNYAILRGSTTSEIADDDRLGGGESAFSTIDVRKLDRNYREIIVRKALDTTEQDNYKLVSGVKERIKKVGLDLPKVEVRFEDLSVIAEVQTGSRALPTLINYARDTIEVILTSLRIFRPQRHTLKILDNVSGVLKPGR